MVLLKTYTIEQNKFCLLAQKALTAIKKVY